MDLELKTLEKRFDGVRMSTDDYNKLIAELEAMKEIDPARNAYLVAAREALETNERLKGENAELREEKSSLMIKTSGLRATCSNLQADKKQFRTALEKAREHERSWLDHGSYDGKEDGTVGLLKIIDEALKDSHDTQVDSQGK